MKKLLVLTLAVVLTFGLAATSEAVLLNVGDSGIATTGEASPGDVLLDSIIGGAWSTASGVTAGTYDAFVYADSDMGDMIVIQYQVTVDSGNLGRVTFITFDGWTTWADSDGTGVDPDSMSRLTADSVGFTFEPSGGIGAGETSSMMWVKTNATEYTEGWINFINGGVDFQPGFQPTVVPEPTSMLLFGTGLLGFVGRLRKRFNA